MSDLDDNLFLGLLGFKLETFVNSIFDNPDASFTSSYFPNLDDQQLEELEYYAYLKGYKVRLKSDVRGSFLLVASHPHVAVSCHLMFVLKSNNVHRSQSQNRFVSVQGSANTIVNGVTVHPDLRARVMNRTDPSPNLLLEVQYRSRQTDAQFHERLVSLITGTSGVMIVLGYSILRHNSDGIFEALVIVYERMAENLPAATYNISFGNVPVTPAHADSWNSGAQAALSAAAPNQNVPLLVGTGAGGPVCTQETGATAPYLITLRQELMLCINSTWPLEFIPGRGPTPGLDFEINLWDVQDAIWSAITEK